MSGSRGFVWTLLLVVIFCLLILSGGAYWYIHSQPGALQIPVYQPATTTPETATSGTATGIISGGVSYPSSCTPSQVACAVDVHNAANAYCSAPTKAGCESEADGSFSITVPVGTYYVYAAENKNSSSKAYYDEFVTCGESASCPVSSHSRYVPVEVVAGSSTTASPVDWYAWQGVPDSITVAPGVNKFYSQMGITLQYPADNPVKTDENISVYPFSTHPGAYIKIVDDDTQTGGYLSVSDSSVTSDIARCLTPGAIHDTQAGWFSDTSYTSSHAMLNGTAFVRSDRTGFGLERDYTTLQGGTICYDVQVVTFPTACVNSGCDNPKWSTQTEQALLDRLDAIAQTFTFLQ